MGIYRLWFIRTEYTNFRSLLRYDCDFSESFDENNQENLSKWIEIYKNIIYGYDSVAELSDNETKAIPYVILSNQLICCAWLSEQEKYKNIFQVNKKMTKWVCENFDKLMIE